MSEEKEKKANFGTIDYDHFGHLVDCGYPIKEAAALFFNPVPISPSESDDSQKVTDYPSESDEQVRQKVTGSPSESDDKREEREKEKERKGKKKKTPPPLFKKIEIN
jgi:hypothetical protein